MIYLTKDLSELYRMRSEAEKKLTKARGELMSIQAAIDQKQNSSNQGLWKIYSDRENQARGEDCEKSWNETL